MEPSSNLTFDRILVALGLAIIVGCFGGTLLTMLADPDLLARAKASPDASIKTYLIVSLVSSYIVAPTTALFGLPVALLVRGAGLSALGSGILTAIAATLGILFSETLVFWNVPSIADGKFIEWAFPFLYAVPSALTFWWLIQPSRARVERVTE